MNDPETCSHQWRVSEPVARRVNGQVWSLFVCPKCGARKTKKVKGP